MKTLLNEQQILACLLTNYEMHENAIEYLEPEDFQDEINRLIFVGIKETETDNLMSIHKATKVSVKDLLELQNAFFTHEQMDYNISSLKDEAIGRQLDINLKSILTKDMTIEQKLEELAKLSELQTFTKRKASVVSLHDSAEQAFKENQETKRNKHKRLYFPYQRLNAMAGALMQGKLVTIAGRTGAGKSAMALHIARHIAEHHKVVYVSLEMSETELANRVFSSKTGISTIDITNGNTTEEQDIAMQCEIVNFEQSNLYITNKGRSTKQIIKIIKEQKPELLIVDSINLMRSMGENERVKINNITRELKQIALEYMIPIIMLCQLNRGADKTILPTLSEIKESSSIEEDSDLCLLLGWIQTVDDYQETNVKYLERFGKSICQMHEFVEMGKQGHRLEICVIAKNRNGALGMIPMKCVASKYLFEEV